MKIITLNIWAGIVYDSLIDFVVRHRDTTDIFCFQEVFHTETDKKFINLNARANIHTELVSVLPDHNYFFSCAQEKLEPGSVPTDYHLEFGLDTFTKKGLEIVKGETFVFRHKNAVVNSDLRDMGRNIQYITFNYNDKEYSLINFHGLWNGQGKSDTQERLEQSRKVRACMDTLPGEKILCGDFNLLPDTQSIKILEEGMVNLITKNNVTNTRSSLYTKSLKFADYVLVSPGVNIKKFEVLQDVVSDHLPLMLEFE